MQRAADAAVGISRPGAGVALSAVPLLPGLLLPGLLLLGLLLPGLLLLGRYAAN